MHNQMEEEDPEGESDTDESDGSDEEDNGEEVPIPGSWNLDFASVMTVNDGQGGHVSIEETSAGSNY